MKKNLDDFISWMVLLTDRIILLNGELKSPLPKEFIYTPSFVPVQLQFTLDNSLPENYENIIENIKSLQSKNSELFKRFLRSCSLYKRGIEFLDRDVTLSFLCFIFAIESLSKFSLGKKREENDYINVIKFFSRYYPIKESDWDFFQEIFRLRNEIVHEGAYFTEEDMKRWLKETENLYSRQSTKKEIFQNECTLLKERSRKLLIGFIENYKV